jgi:outer membrane immunogenic protein
MTTKMLAPAFGAFLVLLTGVGDAKADGMQQPRMTQAHGCIGGLFAGPYIGVNAGFGRVDTRQSSPGDPSATGDDTSFTGGGQVGYNWQCGHVVFGIESDINYVRFEANSTAISGGTTPVNFKDEINWFGTVRGRVGVTVRDHALVYATGGLAYAESSRKFSVPSVPFRQTDDDFKTGWVIGGGIELVHDVRWLLRAEALYVDLRDKRDDYTLPPSSCGAPPCGGFANWDDKFWVARLALSYKFSRDPVPVPLK